MGLADAEVKPRIVGARRLRPYERQPDPDGPSLHRRASARRNRPSSAGGPMDHPRSDELRSGGPHAGPTHTGFGSVYDSARSWAIAANRRSYLRRLLLNMRGLGGGAVRAAKALKDA